MNTARREAARRKMIQDYKDNHPDVDWDTHEMLFIRTRNGGWAIDSHRPRDPELDALVSRLCCGGTCARHRSPGDSSSQTGSPDPESQTDPAPQAA